MRKNTATVLNAWDQNRPSHPSDSIWTDGERIFSYQTCLVERVETPDGPPVTYLNRTRYTPTTSQHQNALAAEFGRCPVVVLTDVPQGVKHLAPVEVTP